MIDRATVERLVGERTWAIWPPALDRLIAGATIRGDASRAAVPGGDARAARRGAVAVVRVLGPLLYRPGILAELFGAVSVEWLIGQVRELASDDDIGSIVLDVDSPGGEVEGMTEAAAEIRAARGRKPVIAVANPMAASAAYWLAAQASEIYVTPSGQVGSLGVFTAHEDLSKLFEALGVRTTLISAGKYKVEGNPYEALSSDTRSYIQAQIDDWYSMFVTDVALGRGVRPSEVRSETYGQGRMLLARAALEAGMVDRIGTLEGAVGRALVLQTGRPAARAQSVPFYRARASQRRRGAV